MPDATADATRDATGGFDAGPDFSDFGLPWFCETGTVVVYSFDQSAPLAPRCHDDDGWSLTASGTTVENGPTPSFGRSRAFSGQDEYLSVDGDELLSLAGEVTVETWLNVARIPASRQRILYSGSSGGPERQFELTADAGGALSWTTYGADCVTPTTVSSNALAPQQWIHVRGVVGAGSLTLYLNGFETATQSQSDFCNGIVGGRVSIGAREMAGGVFDSHYEGELDEVRISNIAR